MVGLLIALAIFGALGVSVTLGSAGRPRHPVRIAVSTESSDGLPAEVSVRVTSEYLAIFDENGLDPGPISAFADETWTHWTFEVPPGEKTLEIDFDARLEPAVQALRVTGIVALDLAGDEVASVRIRGEGPADDRLTARRLPYRHLLLIHRLLDEIPYDHDQDHLQGSQLGQGALSGRAHARHRNQ